MTTVEKIIKNGAEYTMGSSSGGGDIEYIYYSGWPGHNEVYKYGGYMIFFRRVDTSWYLDTINESTFENIAKNIEIISGLSPNAYGTYKFYTDNNGNYIFYSWFYNTNFSKNYYYRVMFDIEGNISETIKLTDTDPGIPSGYVLATSYIPTGKTLKSENGQLYFINSNLIY